MFPIPKKFWDSMSGQAKQRSLLYGIILVIISASIWLCAVLYQSYNEQMQLQYMRGFQNAEAQLNQKYQTELRIAEQKWQQEISAAKEAAESYYELSKESLYADTIESTKSVVRLSSSSAGAAECLPDEFVQQYNKTFGAANSTNAGKQAKHKQ